MERVFKNNYYIIRGEGDGDNDLVGVLVVGESYTFKEVSAPKGYKLAKPVKFTIKDKAEIQTVEVEDKPIPSVPDRPQTGGQSPVIPIAISLVVVVGVLVLLKKKKK